MSNLDNFSAVHSNLEMSDALAKLRQELSQARMSHEIDTKSEAEAQSYLAQAIREVNMPVPSKVTLLDHLDSAKACLSGQGAVITIVEALTQASATVQRLF